MMTSTDERFPTDALACFLMKFTDLKSGLIINCIYLVFYPNLTNILNLK